MTTSTMSREPILTRINRKLNEWYRKRISTDGDFQSRPTRLIAGKREMRELRAAARKAVESLAPQVEAANGHSVTLGLTITRSKRSTYLRVL